MTLDDEAVQLRDLLFAQLPLVQILVHLRSVQRRERQVSQPLPSPHGLQALRRTVLAEVVPPQQMLDAVDGPSQPPTRLAPQGRQLPVVSVFRRRDVDSSQ